MLAQVYPYESHLISIANFPSWNNMYYYLDICTDGNVSALGSFTAWCIIYTNSVHRGLLCRGSVSLYRRVHIDVHVSVQEARAAAAFESQVTWNFRLCPRAWAELQSWLLGTYVLPRTHQQVVTDLRILQPSPQPPKGTEYLLSALKCSRGETR